MKTYKNFLLKTLILMLLLPSILISLILFIGNKTIGKEIFIYEEAQMTHEWLMQKKHIATELSKKGPKIVFLSGSNGLHGINALEIEKETGISTLNYCSQICLEAYIFYDVKKILKKGDIVIMPLEYSFYSDWTEFKELSKDFPEYVISYDRPYYSQLPLSSKLDILFFLFRLSSIIAFKNDINNKYMLDSRGDIIYSKNNKINSKFYTKNTIVKDIKIGKLSTNYKKWKLYEFIQWCNANNIKVYGAAPNIYHSVNSSKSEQASFAEIKKFYNLAGCDFIGRFEDGFFDLRYISNTKYHLNKNGVEIRTAYFIKKIIELKRKGDFGRLAAKT